MQEFYLEQASREGMSAPSSLAEGPLQEEVVQNLLSPNSETQNLARNPKP